MPIRRAVFIFSCIVILAGAGLSGIFQHRETVNSSLMATYESIQPAGQVIALRQRPCDIVERNGLLWVKESARVEVFNRSGFRVGSAQSPGGASQTGLIASPQGVLFSNATSTIHEFGQVKGRVSLIRDFNMPDRSFPTGLAWVEPNKTFLCCLSTRNELVKIDYVSGKILETWHTDVAPYNIIVADDVAIVVCQGGRIAQSGETSAQTVGSAIPVDRFGRASSGVIDAIDLTTGERTVRPVGRQPGAMVYLPKADLLIVANANEDSISFLDPESFSSVGRFATNIDSGLPFGAMPNGLMVSEDESRLYVSLAGNNCVEVLDIKNPRAPKILGYIPTAWYPGALIKTASGIAVTCAQGIGSRGPTRPIAKGRNSWDVTGRLQLLSGKDLVPLADESSTAKRSAKLQRMLSAMQSIRSSNSRPVPVPASVGAPSVFNHVIYVLKENRTYDQVFGDVRSGDGDPSLCVFGQKITPNQHALATQFALLDNYYCNGVCSADGHAWAMEGNSNPYLTLQFGQSARSYDYGTDPLSYSSSGFIWDAIMAKGFTFRNFGELDFPTLPADWKLNDVWRDYEKGNKAVFGQRVDIARLRKYTSRAYPGWEMSIPDVLRMDRFLSEFRNWEKTGKMPNFVIVYLPQDHTAGTSPGYPTPASFVADNDLAVGRLVDALSHSRFWKDTVLFANEDDPQAGYDHVDGHRSTCLVVSPYTKRKATISEFYNQTSVLHTILRIFGCPPMNQKIAIAPIMRNCFTDRPDFTPYTAVDPEVDRRKTNPALSSLTGQQRRLAVASLAIDFRRPDAMSPASQDMLNRAVWSSMKGTTPYPSDLAGSHGKGLASRGLKADASVRDDD